MPLKCLVQYYSLNVNLGILPALAINCLSKELSVWIQLLTYLLRLCFLQQSNSHPVRVFFEIVLKTVHNDLNTKKKGYSLTKVVHEVAE